MARFRTGLRRGWWGVPALAVVSAVTIAVQGLAGSGSGTEVAVVAVFLGVAALGAAWIATSRLEVDEGGRLTVAHLGWSRSVDLSRLTRVVLHPDALPRRSHWVIELHDEEGAGVRLTTAPVYRRGRDVFRRVERAVEDRGVPVSGPARRVLALVTA